MTRYSSTLISSVLILALASCVSHHRHRYETLHPGYGVVDSIAIIEERDSGAAGAVVGAVIGGVIGHQIGSGRGNTAATAAGVATGAYAGSQIDNRRASESYQITIRMQDGTHQILIQDSNPFAVGDRVRIANGRIFRR